jgi:1-deoxy-D-xylulose-5-phosphate synthase
VRILDSIRGHEDLASLTPVQRQQLCTEIRDFLISSVSKTGGHLASNLGVVELSVALETVYNTHKDRLVFDVGHQSYVHKLLTGRQADFAQLRQFGGMAGFPKPSESDADAFTAGHASSSVSIALGMARARTLRKEAYDVVTLIGDGAATGGMVYEALCDVAVSNEPMVIVLNDNEMSIAPNVGGFAQHLSRLRTKESYLGFKEKYRNALSKTPFSQAIYHITRNVKDFFRRVLLPTTIFENMGLTYIGPVDGNDVENMIALLRLAKGMKRPVLLHVHTQKGMGYGPAEAAPSVYHGVGRFDPAVGIEKGTIKETFSAVFGQEMCEIAAENDKICAITAAMPDGTGLTDFQAKFPGRIFDVGIAEEHAVSMAGGLAKQGMIPVVALYSTFLQRSYDQIMQDVAMQKLHVIFAVDRAGLVGEDGETHHGVFDTGFLRQTPGLTVLAPATTAELRQMLRWAVYDQNGPVAIRYPRGGDRISVEPAWNGSDTAVCHRNGADVAIVTYGTILDNVLDAANQLEASGISAGVFRLLRLSRLNEEELRLKLAGYHHVILVEEACSGSGLGETMCALLQDKQVNVMDLGAWFPTHGSLAQLYHHYGLDAEGIVRRVQEVLQDGN